MNNGIIKHIFQGGNALYLINNVEDNVLDLA